MVISLLSYPNSGALKNILNADEMIQNIIYDITVLKNIINSINNWDYICKKFEFKIINIINKLL